MCSSGERDPYISMSALPAGRIAAGNLAGIEVLTLEMDSSELPPAGIDGQPHAEKTMLLSADAFEQCVTCLGKCSARKPRIAMCALLEPHSIMKCTCMYACSTDSKGNIVQCKSPCIMHRSMICAPPLAQCAASMHVTCLLACSENPEPSAMEYSLQSNRLVALHEDMSTAPWYSAITVLDLAAGGRMLCRSSASVCALQPTAEDGSVLRNVRILSAGANRLSAGHAPHSISPLLVIVIRLTLLIRTQC